MAVYLISFTQSGKTAQSVLDGIELWGPFNDHQEAGDWGAKWQKRNGDNPCWQTLELQIHEEGILLKPKKP